MDWQQARERLLSQKNYAEVARAVGLHPNGIRRYAIGQTIPRMDNALKVIEYLMANERRVGDRRRE